MTLPIQSVGFTPAPSYAGPAAGADRAPAGPPFQDFLLHALRGPTSAATDAAPAAAPPATLEQTNHALQLMLRVRDEIVAAYQQVQDIRV